MALSVLHIYSLNINHCALYDNQLKKMIWYGSENECYEEKNRIENIEQLAQNKAWIEDLKEKRTKIFGNVTTF